MAQERLDKVKALIEAARETYVSGAMKPATGRLFEIKDDTFCGCLLGSALFKAEFGSDFMTIAEHLGNRDKGVTDLFNHDYVSLFGVNRQIASLLAAGFDNYRNDNFLSSVDWNKFYQEEGLQEIVELGWKFGREVFMDGDKILSD